MLAILSPSIFQENNMIQKYRSIHLIQNIYSLFESKSILHAFIFMR